MTSTVDVLELLVLSEGRTDGNVQFDGLVTVSVLDNSASTGYHWTCEVVPGTEGRLHLLNDVFVPGRRLTGAPGVRVFLLGADRAGPASVILRLYAPGQTEPVNQFVCSVEISKPEN